MANRAYLYTANQELTLLKDVSEWNYEIPLMYKIVLGVNPEILNSKIWDYQYPIAIQGDFQEGLDKWYLFLKYLKNQKLIRKDIRL